MPRRMSKTSATRPSRPAGTLRIVMPTKTQTPSTSDTAPTTEPATEDVDEFSIASLTLDVPLIPLRPKRRVPATPFHFLSLPSEIRIQIYEYFFHDDTVNEPLDLGPGNYKRIHGKLRLMRVCKQVHDEATYYLYSSRTFRLFPTYPGKYFKSKKPILARMKPIQRRYIQSLELRLGPGWNAPPRGWVVNPALGLNECVDVRTLKVFVECDPSDNIFKGFRRSPGFYEEFSRQLLINVLKELPNVTALEFDGWPSVKKSGNMMAQLLDVAAQFRCAVEWGPERGWTDSRNDEDHIPNAMYPVKVPRTSTGYGPHGLVSIT